MSSTYTQQTTTYSSYSYGNGVPCQVELNFRATDLKDTDLIGKSDPCLVVYQRDDDNDEWKETGRTENIKNNLNPNWQETLVVNHKPGRGQVKFQIFDLDMITKADPMGEFITSMDQVLSAPGKEVMCRLRDPKGKKVKEGKPEPKLWIWAEGLPFDKEMVTLECQGLKLDKKDTFGKSDPWLKISKYMDNNQWIGVHKTEFIKNNCDPKWKPFTISFAKLCNGNQDKPLKFEVYDHDNSNKHELIGQFHITLRNLLIAPAKYPLINEKIKAKKGAKYEDSGKLEVKKVDITV